MAPTTGSSSLLTPDEEAMALLQSGPLSPDVPSDGEVDDGCSSSSASTESTGKLKSDDDDDEIDDEIDDEPEPSSGSRGPLRLRVKCSGSNLRPPPSSGANPGTAAPGAEYPLSASAAATVADLKASVRHAVLGSGEPGGGRKHGHNGERYVRLIVRGRLLAPDAAPVSNFGLRDDDVVHAVVAAAGVRGGPQERLARGVDLSDIGSGGGSGGGANPGSGRRRGRSARGVGIDAAGIIVNGGGAADDGSDSSDSDDLGDGDDADDLEAGRRRRGFDRLRATGLSREEVAILRLHFARHVDRFGERRGRNRRRLERELQLQRQAAAAEEGLPPPPPPTPPPPPSTDARTDRLRLEEEWMAAQGPTSEFRLNLNANAPLVLSALRSRAGGLGGVRGLGLAMGEGGPAGGGGGIGGFAGSLGTTAAAAGGGGLTFAPRQSLVGSDRDFVWGFLLGFFFGFVMLFWVMLPTVPHKQRLGLITGMCVGHVLRTKSNDAFVDDSFDG